MTQQGNFLEQSSEFTTLDNMDSQTTVSTTDNITTKLRYLDTLATNLAKHSKTREYISTTSTIQRTLAKNGKVWSRSHSPSASSVFNSRSFSRIAGGREDSGGSAILLGRECSSGSAKKRRNFPAWSGRGKLRSTNVYVHRSRKDEGSTVSQIVTWHGRWTLPSVQQDHPWKFPQKPIIAILGKINK